MATSNTEYLVHLHPGTCVDDGGVVVVVMVVVVGDGCSEEVSS